MVNCSPVSTGDLLQTFSIPSKGHVRLVVPSPCLITWKYKFPSVPCRSLGKWVWVLKKITLTMDTSWGVLLILPHKHPWSVTAWNAMTGYSLECSFTLHPLLQWGPHPAVFIQPMESNGGETSYRIWCIISRAVSHPWACWNCNGSSVWQTRAEYSKCSVKKAVRSHCWKM